MTGALTCQFSRALDQLVVSCCNTDL